MPASTKWGGSIPKTSRAGKIELPWQTSHSTQGGPTSRKPRRGLEFGSAPRAAHHVRNVFSEGKRMASGHTGNVVPGNRLRVRVPCPPL